MMIKMKMLIGSGGAAADVHPHQFHDAHGRGGDVAPGERGGAVRRSVVWPCASVGLGRVSGDGDRGGCVV